MQILMTISVALLAQSALIVVLSRTQTLALAKKKA
jgi:hypothetical protein